MNMKKALKVALGTGLFLLDQSDRARKSVRERIGDHVDDLGDVAQDTFQAAADRVAGAAKSFRTKEDHRAFWNVLGFAAGIGIGVGVGLLSPRRTGKRLGPNLWKKR